MFELVASILLYFFAPLIVCRLAFTRCRELPVLLVLAGAMIFQQIVFLSVAKILGSYAVSFLSAAIITSAIGYAVSSRFHKEGILQTARFKYYHLIPVIFFFAVFLLYLLIRSHYPFIAFINNGNEVGVEKLYNLSLHQSFLYGHGWPTQWIWLSGEPVRYYVFLKSIPGVIAWIARASFNAPDTGGALFILSEAFFVSLTPAIMSAWILWFCRGASSSLTALWSLVFPLFGLLGYHFKGFWMGLSSLLSGTPIDWWQTVDQVIPYTQSQYPVWLMLLGDNHAYSQVYFLQVLLWGAVLALVLLPQLSWVLSASVGILAAAVLLSHPGSVLIDLATLAPFVLISLAIVLVRKDYTAAVRIFKNFSIAALTSAVIAAWLYVSAGAVKVVFPDKKLLSPLVGMLNQNFCLLLLLTVLCFFTWKKTKQSKYIDTLLLVVFAVIAFVLHRPGISVALLSMLLVVSSLRIQNYSPQVLFALCAFLILIPPEIIAFDHTMDSRVEWIRFQMSLRFWPESYILIPFAVGIAFFPQFIQLPQRKKQIAFGILFSIVVLCAVSHVPAIANRLSRVNQERSIDGFSEFYKRYPSDTKIVTYLRGQSADRQIVIAELCSVYGSSNIPEHFGWPGRIAAYSGRAAICGWGRHAALYNNPLTGPGFKGSSVEEKVMGFSRVYQRLLSHGSSVPNDLSNLDKLALRTYGVTHVVFGEWEKRLFPNMTLQVLARIVDGQVELPNEDGTGIVVLR